MEHSQKEVVVSTEDENTDLVISGEDLQFNFVRRQTTSTGRIPISTGVTEETITITRTLLNTIS